VPFWALFGPTISQALGMPLESWRGVSNKT